MAELKDLVQFALDKQPSKFKDTFGELVTQRVVDRVAELKAEVSANMFGEAPESDEDEDDIEDLDDADDEDVVYDDEDDLPVDDDEDLLADFDLEDDELPQDDGDELNFEDEDDEIEEDIVDEDDESFSEESLDALEEETTHRLSPQDGQSYKDGQSIGVRGPGGKISGFLHVSGKRDATGKKSMFGNHHQMRYAQIGSGTGKNFDGGAEHDLGVQKFSQSALQKQISDIHAKAGK